MNEGGNSAEHNAQRDRILALSADLFWAKGFHGASMNDVAEAVGLRKPSLYHYISTKEELLYELSAASLDHITEVAKAVSPEQNAVNYLHALITSHIEALLAEPAMHAVALVELKSLPKKEKDRIAKRRDQYAALFDQAIERVQATTTRWQGLPPQVVRFAILGMLNWVVFWYRPDGGYSPKDVSDMYAAVLLDGSDS